MHFSVHYDSNDTKTQDILELVKSKISRLVSWPVSASTRIAEMYSRQKMEDQD